MFNAPLSLERAEYLISLFDLTASAQVVDLGCGDGMFLRLFAQQHQIVGIGVDKDNGLIQTAKVGWDDKNHTSMLEFVSADANDYVKQMTPVDVIICIGAEYVFGGYQNLLEIAKPLLKPGGKLLIGTIYWKQPPSLDYLSLMNGEDGHFDLQTTVGMAYRLGFLPLDVGRSNDDEWDRFESRVSRKRYQSENKHNDTWQWQKGYLQWGINTMGFCFIMFEKSDE